MPAVWVTVVPEAVVEICDLLPLPEPNSTVSWEIGVAWSHIYGRGIHMATPDAQNKKPHDNDATRASDGAGTVNTPLDGETLDHPILDGATEHYGQEEEAQDPRYGEADPVLIRHPDKGKKSKSPYN